MRQVTPLFFFMGNSRFATSIPYDESLPGPVPPRPVAAGKAEVLQWQPMCMSTDFPQFCCVRCELRSWNSEFRLGKVQENASSTWNSDSESQTSFANPKLSHDVISTWLLIISLNINETLAACSLNQASYRNSSWLKI